jgi:hypothetical protein
MEIKHDMDSTLSGDQESSSPPWKDVGSVLNRSGIEKFLSKLAVYTEAKYHSNYAEIHLRPNIGTTLYYAEGETGIRWLEKNACKVERKPQVLVYHLRYGEPVKAI